MLSKKRTSSTSTSSTQNEKEICDYTKLWAIWTSSNIKDMRWHNFHTVHTHKLIIIKKEAFGSKHRRVETKKYT